MRDAILFLPPYHEGLKRQVSSLGQVLSEIFRFCLFSSLSSQEWQNIVFSRITFIKPGTDCHTHCSDYNNNREYGFEKFSTQEVFFVCGFETCCQIRICQHSHRLIFPWMKFCPLYNIRPAEIRALIRSQEQMEHIPGLYFSALAVSSTCTLLGQLRVIWNWYQKCLDPAPVWKWTRRSPGGDDILRLIILFLHLKYGEVFTRSTRSTYLHVKPVY